MAGTPIEFDRPDGQAVSGYLAEPASGQGPGVVVIQEWWGLNDQVRGVADRFARAGFVALVPDLYRGKATIEAEERHRLVEDALASLPGHQRVPLVLFHFEDMPYDEIARRLGVSLAKVKTDILRGRAALAASLARCGAVREGLTLPPR